MKRDMVLLLIALSAIMLIGARTAGSTSGTVWLFVARDRDADRAVSVGDEVRWFVSSTTDATVTLTCWQNADKTTQTFVYTTGTLTGNEVANYGTSTGLDLTTPGYCESRGTTIDGKTFGFHWVTVIP